MKKTFIIIIIFVSLILVGGLVYWLNWPAIHRVIFQYVTTEIGKAVKEKGVITKEDVKKASNMSEKEFQEWERKSKQLSTDTSAKSNFNQIQISLLFYFDKNQYYPRTLSDLEPEFISKDYLENIPYIYAYSSDRKSYHLGLIINNPDYFKSLLANDADFNSKISAYVNGFNGNDPVYDVKSQ